MTSKESNAISVNWEHPLSSDLRSYNPSDDNIETLSGKMYSCTMPSVGPSPGAVGVKMHVLIKMWSRSTSFSVSNNSKLQDDLYISFYLFERFVKYLNLFKVGLHNIILQWFRQKDGATYSRLGSLLPSIVFLFIFHVLSCPSITKYTLEELLRTELLTAHNCLPFSMDPGIIQ